VAINDVAGKGCIMHEIFFVNLLFIIYLFSIVRFLYIKT